jgi:hypothetical protein
VREIPQSGGGKERMDLPDDSFGLSTHHTPLVDQALRAFERGTFNGA